MIQKFRHAVSSQSDAMNGQVPSSGQLDLFLHSRAAVLANDVIDTLIARDAVRAAECLDRLRAEEPTHRTCKALEALCQILREWPFPSSSPTEIAEAIRRLETDTHPAALAAMGDKAGEFMRPFWRDLAQAAGPHVYDAAFPQSYSAALYLRCGDPEAAVAAALAVAHRDDNVDALHWLAVARYRTDGLDACRIPLMRLALLGPERLPAALSEIDDPLLNRDWQAFHATCHWLDSEDKTVGTWFPAWHLVEHPGIRINCGGPVTLPATRATQTFSAIARLLELEKHGYSTALVSARSRLRELDPDMFAFYMARRNVGHR
ncbi:MAG: hypothetical protein HY323_13415 [Betaproteobacteria bacterium]|nr:hypothetical protein [Betaproteobacteria bacterium]